MNQEELEFTGRMLERSDVMVSAVYKMCLTFLQFEEEESMKKFPWDISILGEIQDFTIQKLRQKGYPVCDPYIIRGESAQYCDCEECKMESCDLHG